MTITQEFGFEFAGENHLHFFDAGVSVSRVRHYRLDVVDLQMCRIKISADLAATTEIPYHLIADLPVPSLVTFGVDLFRVEFLIEILEYHCCHRLCFISISSMDPLYNMDRD